MFVPFEGHGLEDATDVETNVIRGEIRCLDFGQVMGGWQRQNVVA
jgi:hypothetical protein